MKNSLSRSELVSHMTDSPLYPVVIHLLHGETDIDTQSEKNIHIPELRLRIADALSAEAPRPILHDLQTAMDKATPMNRWERAVCQSRLILLKYMSDPQYRLRELKKMKNRIRQHLLKEV